MQKLTLLLALTALVVSLLALGHSTYQPAQAAPAVHEGNDMWMRERNYPPLVFTSRATLDCAISSTRNGRQVMTTVAGQGFSFSTPMRPIKEGMLQLKAPGMHYEFNSFPTAPIPASFTGLGAGTITEMKAEIAVDVKRFQQPGGPGTNIHFNAADIDSSGAYVEFTGLFVRGKDSKPFPFRVLFASVAAGQGDVQPVDAKPQTNIHSKSVSLGTRSIPATVITALYEAEDDVAPLK